MVETFEPGKSLESLTQGKPFLVLAHAYQPHREVYLPSSGQRLDIVSGINETIYNQVYKPVLVEGESLPRMAFSLYPGLRDWLRNAHPKEYERLVAKINAIPGKEYHVLGDPYIHMILPLQTRADQGMMLGIGREAFRRDLGFEPKGLWLPETAVSSTTLDVASENGYEFVVLRDSQLKRKDTNPVKTVTPGGRGMSIVHFNSSLSGSLSFDDGVSLNADRFLDRVSGFDSSTVVVGSDIELYGHHKKDRDKFLNYLERPGTLEGHGFVPFDLRKAMDPGETDAIVTEVWDDSSWSCDHGLGRWTGECGCDGVSERAAGDKRYLYQTLGDYGSEINMRLDAADPAWRKEFTEFFLGNRGRMFNPGSDSEPIRISDRLFWAKYCELVGKTSCGWFFGNDGSPEREIPRAMIGEIEKLVPNIRERTVFNSQAA